MKIGDAILAPNYDRPKLEGFIVEFDRYGQKGTVCAYVNFEGDGMYIDYDPKYLEIVSIGALKNETMKKDCLDLRQIHYLKHGS